MGVECKAMVYVGKWVEDAEAYLIEKGILQVGELAEKYGGDLGYMSQCELEVQPVSYWSDCGCYVGFEVSPSDYKKFDYLIARFKELTGDDCEVESFEHWY